MPKDYPIIRLIESGFIGLPDVYKKLITELTEIARKFGEDVYVVWVLTTIMQKRDK